MSSHPLPPLFDPAEIERLQSEIGIGGVRRLLDVYQLDLERRMTRMETAFAQHDFKSLAVECHALKAATQAIGLSRFASELSLLEASAKQMSSATLSNPHPTDTEERIETTVRRKHLHLVLNETRPYLSKLSSTFQGKAQLPPSA